MRFGRFLLALFLGVALAACDDGDLPRRKVGFEHRHGAKFRAREIAVLPLAQRRVEISLLRQPARARGKFLVGRL